jgi:NAD(P) transhydrogenase subunit alpha
MARIAVLRESAPAEGRVAATPETVKKLIALGATVAVEEGSGAGAKITDESFAAAGAQIGSAEAVLSGADIVMTVQGAAVDRLQGIASGTRLLGLLDPVSGRERVAQYAAAGIEALAMEFMPRITRAQSMDVLSSPVEPVRLQGGARCRRRIWPGLPDDDDGGGHGVRPRARSSWASALRACRRSRPRGGSARRCRRPTCVPPPRNRSNHSAPRPIFVEDVKGIEGEARAAMPRRCRTNTRPRRRSCVVAHRQAGHRHHHRAHSRSPGAAPDHRRADRQR